MTGRGIDQILPHPGNPRIHEPYLKDARGYVEIAEKANGPIRKPVDFPYIWGEALEELEQVLGVEAKYVAKDVTISGLKVHMILSEDINTVKGQLLISRGQEVSPVLINRLKNFADKKGIKEPIRVLVPLQITDE